MFAAAGLRVTRPRFVLARLLFGEGEEIAHRHVTADMLYHETQKAKEKISMATIYNTLNLFLATGLLRSVPVDGGRLWFDTNTAPHQHFYIEDKGELRDCIAAVPEGARPKLPAETDLVRTDIMFRLRSKSGAKSGKRAGKKR